MQQSKILFRTVSCGLILLLHYPSATALAERPPGPPSGLLVDLLFEPLGLENTQPRFSWIVNDPDSNERQTAYQIIVAQQGATAQPPTGNASAAASDLEGREILWDSGKVDSADSSAVRYEGPPLEPNRIYYWQVRTWDIKGLQGAFSDPQRFATGPSNQWSGLPIWAPARSAKEPNSKEPEFVFFRKSFVMEDKPIRCAIIHVTAQSPEPAAQFVYRLWVNGEFVGMGPERGFNDIKRYNSFDVTDRLNLVGENVISALNYTQQEKCFLLELTVHYDDGSRQTVASDQSWKVLDGDSVYRDQGNAGDNRFYYLPREGIEANLYPLGWKLSGFDDARWDFAVEKPPLNNLQASVIANPQLWPIAPKHVSRRDDGSLFVDFGKNINAGLELDVTAAQGSSVEIRLGEELDGVQSIRYPMRTGNHYQEVWTLREGRQTLENFGYRSFRYAEIRPSESGTSIDHIRALVLRNPFSSNAAHFEFSHFVLNDVWNLCKYTIEGNSLGVYVDTHTRERRNYEGDALINQLSHYSLDREFALPRYSIEYLYFRPTWPAEYKPQSILMAWNDYLYTGNKESIQRHFDLLRQTKTFEEFINARHLVEKDINLDGVRYGRDLVDWPPSQRDGFEFTRINTVVNAFHCRALQCLGELAAVVDRIDQSRHYLELAEKQRRAINDHLFESDSGYFRDGLGSRHASVHASAFPLALGLVDQKWVSATADYVESRAMATSVYGAQFVLDGLYEAGRGKAAMERMVATSQNSWGRKIYELGATMAGEAWDPEQKSNMSFSHAWGTAPANIIPRQLFGIVPLEPAFKKFQVRPQVGTLDWGSIEVPTIRGTIGVAFANQESAFEMEVVIPANCVAEVHLPLMRGQDTSVLVDGTPTLGQIENGCLKIPELGSGHHRLISR